MISGVAASIERPEWGASHMDVRPRLNLFTQLYTVANVGVDDAMNIIQFGFDFFRR